LRVGEQGFRFERSRLSNAYVLWFHGGICDATKFAISDGKPDMENLGEKP
jgi:hypothetical protein